MNQCNLDWKTVFKQILGSSSDKKSMVTEKNKDLIVCCDTVSSNLKEVESHNSFEEISSINKEINSPKIPLSNFNCSGKVPEWNKVFKEILGNKSDLNTQEKKTIKHSIEDFTASMQKPSTSLKQEEQVKNRYYEKRDFKPKMSKEEREVEELLARSRLFVIQKFKLNDFEGAGVDCFKDGKSCLTPISRESFPKEVQSLLVYEDDNIRYWNTKRRSFPQKEFTRNAEYRKPRKVIVKAPCIPFDEKPWDVETLEESVVNVKSLTRDDTLNVVDAPFDESPWDDDFLF